MPVWPVQDAEARFSEFLERCLSEGPQVVSRRGAEAAVLVRVDEWRRLQAAAEETREHDVTKAAELERRLEQVAASYDVLPMDATACREWGRLTQRKSDTLVEDAMIAATARTHDLVVVTRNVADFETLGVKTLDPFKTRTSGDRRNRCAERRAN